MNFNDFYNLSLVFGFFRSTNTFTLSFHCCALLGTAGSSSKEVCEHLFKTRHVRARLLKCLH